ncbi:MAG: hypothetical protein Q8T13_06535 [Acidobacteriota bacterium]|nr:hypothetical protein [Acidobacteriota bacterium]
MPRSAGALLAALVLGTLVAAQAPDAVTLRDQLDAYLLAYEPKLSTLLADEEMTQRMQEGYGGRRVTHRRIRSEVAFIALPGDAGWLGFRRVVKVNDKAIKDHGVPLGQLMAEGASDDYDQARLLLADSAAHNLGAPRTINLPNLPLELLHPRNRHRFAQELAGREKIRGVQTVVLRLDEFATPTVIQQANGGDMKTVVWAWVEPESGRLLRANVNARDARFGLRQFSAVIRVDFKEVPALDLLVPSEMKETFFVERNSQGTGTAKYTNYRRFQTAARILPQ